MRGINPLQKCQPCLGGQDKCGRAAKAALFQELMMQYEFRHSDSQACSSDNPVCASFIGIAKELAHLSREHSFNMFAVTRPGEAAACGFLVIAA